MRVRRTATQKRHESAVAFRHSFSSPEVADRISVEVIKIFFHYVPRARARDRHKAQLAVATRSADAEGEACSEWSLVCAFRTREALFCSRS